ncbi:MULTISPECIES: type II toxin-antitoxin system RelE/ParE family toxin [unclassified Microcoleus]|uniref:type II toxin-antitoxin system RelE/ParE family toxin n=1 Tax=unclassified Microcoleus TaxID=2642155 RepID=UPI002FD2C4C1
MSSYSFSDDAVQDLDEICEYISGNNYSAASKLFDRMRERCKVTADFPNMGKIIASYLPACEDLLSMITSFVITQEKRELM